MGKYKLGNKGVSVWQLAQIGMTFVFVGVTLSVGLWVNEQMATTAFDVTTTNQSITFTNDTYSVLAYRASSVSSVANATYTFPSGNTSTLHSGFRTHVRLRFGTNSEADSSLAYNVTYGAYDTDEYMVVMNSTQGLSTLTQWLPIIAIVIAAAVVIGTLVVAFAFRR